MEFDKRFSSIELEKYHESRFNYFLDLSDLNDEETNTFSEYVFSLFSLVDEKKVMVHDRKRVLTSLGHLSVLTAAARFIRESEEEERRNTL